MKIIEKLKDLVGTTKMFKTFLAFLVMKGG
jgi:hypothetical protein